MALESTSAALQAAATPSQLPAPSTKRPGCRRTPGPGRTIAVGSARVLQDQRMHGRRIRRSPGEPSRSGSLIEVTGSPGQHRDLDGIGAWSRSGEGRASRPTPRPSCSSRRRGRRRSSRRLRISSGESPVLAPVGPSLGPSPGVPGGRGTEPAPTSCSCRRRLRPAIPGLGGLSFSTRRHASANPPPRPRRSPRKREGNRGGRTDTSRRSPPWSHGPDRGDRRDGDPRFTAEIAETAEMGPEPGERVGRVRGTGARFALGHLLGVFLGGLCGLRGESVPSLAAVRRVVQKVVIAQECRRTRDPIGSDCLELSRCPPASALGLGLPLGVLRGHRGERREPFAYH